MAKAHYSLGSIQGPRTYASSPSFAEAYVEVKAAMRHQSEVPENTLKAEFGRKAGASRS